MSAHYAPTPDEACIADWDSASYTSTTPHCLRRLDGTKVYPRDLEGEVHADGEIWSASLWAFRGAVGPATADRAIVEAQFGFAPGTSMPRRGRRRRSPRAQRLYGTTVATAARRAFAAHGLAPRSARARRVAAPGAAREHRRRDGGEGRPQWPSSSPSARSATTCWTSSPTWSSSGRCRATRWRPTARTCCSSAPSSTGAASTARGGRARRPRRLPGGPRHRRAPTGRRWPPPPCSARPRACAPSTATCAASRSSTTTRRPTCARRARASGCPRCSPRRGRAAAGARRAGTEPGRPARPGAARAHVRLRAARLGGGRPRGPRRRPQGAGPAHPRQGRQGAPGARRARGAGRRQGLAGARAPGARRARARRRGCSSTAAAPA